MLVQYANIFLVLPRNLIYLFFKDRSIKSEVSVFAWLTQTAKTTDIQTFDRNADNVITTNELLQFYGESTNYTLSEEDKTIASILLEEYDANRDGKTTIDELFQHLVLDTSIGNTISGGMALHRYEGLSSRT